jgi:hypothetical protein
LTGSAADRNENGNRIASLNVLRNHGVDLHEPRDFSGGSAGVMFTGNPPPRPS